MKSLKSVKQTQESVEQEQEQIPERLDQYTVNELSLAGATGLDPSSDLVKHFAKSYSEIAVTSDAD
jgi:hypothetical protein